MVGQGDLKHCPQAVFCTFDKRGRLSGFSVHANGNMQTMKKGQTYSHVWRCWHLVVERNYHTSTAFKGIVQLKVSFCNHVLTFMSVYLGKMS